MGKIHQGHAAGKLAAAQLDSLGNGTAIAGLRAAAQQLLQGGLGLLVHGEGLLPGPVHGDGGDGIAAWGVGQTVDPKDGHLLLACGAAGKQQRQAQEQKKQALFHVSSSSRRARGSSTMNTVPLPDCRCSARMAPPRRRTVSLTMLRPRPVPPTARDRFLSTR